jgi:photosynthetic reaction center cytochrome c subunit
MTSMYGGQRAAFVAVFALITVLLLGASLWVLNFVRSRAVVIEPPDPNLSPIYIDFAGRTADYVSAESLAAMGRYISANEQPQNVQILQGMSTSAIGTYMVYQLSGGLRVDCTHCHSLDNFAADEWDDPVAMQNKVTARQHMLMAADLNQNWLTQLAGLTDQKHPSGAQITCATCHFGVAKPQAWPENQVALPDNFRLPLDDLSILKVNAREDISLDTVQYNQYTMYHMNTSLSVGCTHCHNSRYFPSYEQPAKYYALKMLEMTQHIRNEYSDVLGDQEPSCTLCHYGRIIPPGSAKSAADVPAMLSSAPPAAAGSASQ